MHSDYYNTQKLLKIKTFNPGTLTQILMYYDVYMFYDEANFPIEDINEIDYSVAKNQLIINEKFVIDNNTIVYNVTYDEGESEFKFDVSQIILNYDNLTDDNREFFFEDDFGHDNFPVFHYADNKVVYSKEGIDKFYIELLSIYQKLLSREKLEEVISESNRKFVKSLKKQLTQATLYLEMVVANIKIN
jgi:hypothetical protein